MSQLPLRLERYFALAKQRPDLFRQQPGGIIIDLDPSSIARTERLIGQKLAVRGLAKSGALVGLVFDDPYFLVLRDAVTFPDGSVGTYARIIMKGGGGSAVLPFYAGRILLLKIHRHAVRNWLYEIPRGAIDDGKSPIETALAELFEEMGGRATEIRPLGFCYGSSATSFTGVHLFFARLSEFGSPQLSEGIIEIRALTPMEFETAILNGEILDSFTLAAFLQAKLAGLFDHA